MRFLFLLVITFALQPVSKAQNFSKVDSFVDYLRQNEQFMGAISLKKGSATPVTYVGGFSSVESRAAVNTKTTFRIGSITKMFTSVMIHQLWEEGKLDLTDKLSMYFPEFPGGENITLSNLLYHQSGIHNFTDEQEYVAYMTEPKTHEEMLAIMMKYPADFEPGADSKYSNSNYVLLGYIIEQVTGSSYKEQLEQRIVKPLGLKQTKAGFPGNSESEEAYSYIDASVKWMPSPVTDLSIPHGAGMIVSTPSDLCIFIEGLFKGKLLADSTVDEMTRLRGRYGKGIFFIPFYEHKAYGHTGGIDGFVSSLAYFPKDSLAIAICLNGMRY
ncbi:MAG: serine hydrolase domain-containing protein, partial [Bacteroidia bacterium]